MRTNNVRLCNFEQEKMSQIDYQKFITNVLSQGRFSFTRDEVVAIGASPDLARRALSRYIQKGNLYSVRQGFYVIITPEFLHQKRVPELMFIDDLMQYLDSPYYISHLSAAALYGAGHQQPMTFFVTNSNKKFRDINNDKHRINFIYRQQWDSQITSSFKTRAGYVQVSTPEATMFDLVESQKILGLGRIIEVVQELADTATNSKLKGIVNCYPVAISQRLGYILDMVGGDSSVIEKSLKNKKVHPVPFSLAKKRRGDLNDKWKIIINDVIQTDI